MTKVYCDICKKEVSKIETFVFPVLKDMSRKDPKGNTLCLYKDYVPESVDCCVDCKNAIGSFLRRYSYALQEHDGADVDVAVTLK